MLYACTLAADYYYSNSMSSVCHCLVFSVEGEKEIQKLQHKVYQLKEELASAQAECKLAQTRAEVQANKVSVLEQQLSRTKTNLEQEIRMKDQAAEQQLQQTKAALEHEIQVKDQKIVTLSQQLHEMKEHQNEVEEQAIASAQQQFDNMKATLEHQIEAKEQPRIALEIQIQTKDEQLQKRKRNLYQRQGES